jgi:hypothetical protein
VTSGGKSVPVAHSRSRRPRGRRPPVSVLRPILTIQRSQGFVWNQVSFSIFFFHRAVAALLLLRECRARPIRVTVSSQRDEKLFVGPLRSTVHKRPLYVYIFTSLPCRLFLPLSQMLLLLPRPPLLGHSPLVHPRPLPWEITK